MRANVGRRRTGDWFETIGGETAKRRWIDLPSSSHVSRETLDYIAAATALLRGSRAVAACCGDKKALGRSSKAAYYKKFYDFAKLRPGISVVRAFPGNRDDAEREKHNDPKHPGILGIEAQDPAGWTTAPLNLGFVLFRHSDLYSALIHWTERGRFTWQVTSDPLLTLVMRDWWGELLKRAEVAAAEKAKGVASGTVRGFAERLGIRITAELRGRR